MEHSPQVCPHCLFGCTHPHRPSDPLVAEIETHPIAAFGFSGRWTRRGGVFTHDLGLELSTDDWRKTRCNGCGTELMTPLDLVPPMTPLNRDGTFQMACEICIQRARRAMAASRQDHRYN